MKYNEKEKGVALLLALGFAALLLVLIMGFATNALIERKVASNNGDKTQARSLAMSAVNRAIVAMQYHMVFQSANNYDTGVNRFDNIVSKSDSSDSAIADADLEGIFKKINNDTYLFEYRRDFPVYEYPKLAARDYNYNGETKTAAFNRRRVPQWQYVKNSGDTEIIGRFMYAALPDLGRGYKKAAEAFDYTNKVRVGRSVSEFDIVQIRADLAGVDFKHPAKWFEDNKPTTMTNDFKNKAFTLFNTIEFDSDISAAPTLRNKKFRNADGTFTQDMVNVFSMPQTVDALFAAVPYLNEIESGDKTDLEKQIAANLIMAFNPPSENAFTDNSNNPTFMGNGRTPYLNEIELLLDGLKADVKVTYTKDTDGNIIKRTHEITPKITAHMSAELYDPYKAYGTASYAVKSDSGIKIELSVKDTKKEFEMPEMPEASLTDSFYHTLSVDSTFVGDKVTIDDVTAPYTIVAKIKYLPKAWKLTKGTNVIDFANILAADEDNPADTVYFTSELTISNSLGEGDHTQDLDSSKYISFQVKDARVNLKNDQWNRSVPASTNIGFRNIACISGDSDGDGADDQNGVEIAAHFPDVSTAENKAKVSLADLAFISRGVAGKTLDILHIPSGGADTLNDKKLLDQLTTYDTASESDPQLIDINSRSVYLWRGLLSNIKDSADNVVFSDPTAIAEKISAAMATFGPLRDRSDFVKILTEADSSLAADKKQSVVGKILSICKVEDYPEYAHLIVVAQTVKDNQGLGTPGTFDSNDEITSEVRYLVRLHRKPDNKMEIVWMEELPE